MEVTKKDVAKLIEIEKTDSFFNHLWNFILYDYRTQGEISRDFIKLWRSNFWNRGFYPIFKFEFDANDHLINISGKLNPITKFLIGVASIFFAMINFPENPLEIDYFKYWPVIVVVLVFLFILIIVFRKFYLSEKQNQLDEIFELLDIETEEKAPEKEWSVKNILIRLFTYPFCLFLIGLNVFIVIPEKQFILAIANFGVVSFYLITDLKMIFRRKNDGKNSKIK